MQTEIQRIDLTRGHGRRLGFFVSARVDVPKKINQSVGSIVKLGVLSHEKKKKKKHGRERERTKKGRRCCTPLMILFLFFILCSASGGGVDGIHHDRLSVLPVEFRKLQKTKKTLIHQVMSDFLMNLLKEDMNEELYMAKQAGLGLDLFISKVS